MEMVMKHIDARNIMEHLEKISALVEKLVFLRADDYILSMVKYVIEKSEIPNQKMFYDWTQTHLSPQLEDTAMTFAEQLRAEGYQEGIQLGMQQGIQHEKMFLNRQLTRRFGSLCSKNLLKLEAADAETLLVWSERIFDAKTIEEVFAE